MRTVVALLAGLLIAGVAHAADPVWQGTSFDICTLEGFSSPSVAAQPGLTVTGQNCPVNSDISISGRGTGAVDLLTATHASNGTAAAPGYAFRSDATTGLYLPGAGMLGVAAGGASIADYGATTSGTLTIPVPVVFTYTVPAAQWSITTDGNIRAAFTATGTGSIQLGNASAAGMMQIKVSSAAGQPRELTYFSGSNARWASGSDGSTESGANAGSNWFVARYNDAGSLLDNPLSISRATGTVTLADLLQLTPVIVSALPTCSPSVNAYAVIPVSDATSPSWGSTLSGSGSTKVLAFCNTSNWVAM